VMCTDSLTAVDMPIDFFYAWHAVEHLPAPFEVLSLVRQKMSPDGVAAIQVPKLRTRHLAGFHYNFYTPSAITALLKRSGYEVVAVHHDLDRDFLTAIARCSAGNKF
jgi:hypothetical protein